MNTAHQAGKGSKPRPVNGDSFRANHEAIFGKKQQRHPNGCRQCGGPVAPGIAIRQTYVGSPDFPGETGLEIGCTISYGGPGKLGEVMKCRDCGHSFTTAGDK